jgi:hypothetical protein
LDSIIFFTDQHSSTPRRRLSSISLVRRLLRCRTKGLDLERRAQQNWRRHGWGFSLDTLADRPAKIPRMSYTDETS